MLMVNHRLQATQFLHCGRAACSAVEAESLWLGAGISLAMSRGDASTEEELLSETPSELGLMGLNGGWSTVASTD